MRKRENWAERFERRKEENEERVLNISKNRRLVEYNASIKELKEKYLNIDSSDYNTQILILENMLDIYYEIEKLEIDGISVKKEIRKLEENINYLKFKQQYLEEHHVEEFSIDKIKRQAEMEEIYYEQKLSDLKKETLEEDHYLKMKKMADRSKEAQSWEEYKNEEKEMER